MRTLITILLLFTYEIAFGQLYSTGLVFNDDKYDRANSKALLDSDLFDALPESASLKKYCPRPGNQLQLNTSPAWATSWSAKTILEAKKNNWTDRTQITYNTFSPAFLYYNIRPINDETCEAGVDLFDALTFLKDKGVKKYEEYLEFCPRGIPNEIIDKKSTYGISDFTKLFETTHPAIYKINAIKKSLTEDYPVVIGMHCPPSFYHAKNVWQPSEMASFEYPGHALCIIGYDDDKFGGSFEIINSWGSEWGNDGFLWIRYDDLVNFMRYGYEVFNLDRNEKGSYDFSSSISLKLNTGLEITMHKKENGIYVTENPLKTGTYFRVYLENKTPAFVYVFGVDESKNLFQIFPHEENISPALIYETNEMAIPGEDNYIEIIGDPGHENLCIVYTKQPLDFNELLINIEKYPDILSENLDALLDGKLISSDEISWAEHGIGFNAQSTDKTTIFIQIQIDHI